MGQAARALREATRSLDELASVFRKRKMMSDLKNDEKFEYSYLPQLISIFMVYAQKLSGSSDPKMATMLRDLRNRLTHDPAFAVNPEDMEQFLSLTDQYMNKAGHYGYTTHVGLDVESRLVSVKAHERGHAAIPWKGTAGSTNQPKTPACAELLLRLLLCRNDVDAILGDLTEMYDQRLAKYGECRARFWFYGQIWLSLLPLLKRAISSKWLRRLIPW
jgi:hypothetical protein